MDNNNKITFKYTTRMAHIYEYNEETKTIYYMEKEDIDEPELKKNIELCREVKNCYFRYGEKLYTQVTINDILYNNQFSIKIENVET